MKRMTANARAQRGFTLVELMVAMVAGLFVSITVFTLAKHASAFAMRQSRVADATLQSVIGFERLKADIARADAEALLRQGGDDVLLGDRAVEDAQVVAGADELQLDPRHLLDHPLTLLAELGELPLRVGPLGGEGLDHLLGRGRGEVPRQEVVPGIAGPDLHHRVRGSGVQRGGPCPRGGPASGDRAS